MPRRIQTRRHARHLTARRSGDARTSGYALTVFKNSTISRFNVRLINPLPDSGTAGVDLVLARASGRIIDLYGGVPSGASGSPVYINGRLVGAISTQFYPDDRLVGITPIAEMLAIANEMTVAKVNVLRGAAVPSPARITVTGISSGRALNEINERFGTPLSGCRDTGVGHRSAERLRPGSALGAALMIGDIKLGFIGTATSVNNDQVFAFGHPLLFSGPTSLALTTAHIADTARGDVPNKIASLGEVIGTVLQDRSAGIYARLNQQPALIPMQLDVMDEDRDRTESLQVQGTPIPSEIPFLTYIAALESMQRAMNRVGAGSALWDWTIRLAGVKEPTTITGGVYDPYDIGGTVAASILPVLEQLLQTGRTIQSIRLATTVTLRKLPELE